MKRLLSALFILILSSFTCFAAIESTFEQKSECLLVDLASTRYYEHTENPTWNETFNYSPSTYHDEQILSIIGLVGDKAKTSDLTLKVDLVSGGWFYIYDGNDTRYKRPFSIQILGRRKENLYGSGGSHANLGAEYNAHLGTDPSQTSVTLTVPQAVASQYEGIWWDMILVFDNNVDTDNNTVLGPDDSTVYNLLPSDSYYTAVLDISITWGSDEADTATYTLYLNGYYKSSETYDGDDNTITSTINVTPLAGANSVDIKTLFNSYTSGATAEAQVKADVASYSFTTNTLSGQRTGTVSMFLSNVSSGVTNAGEEFMLRHMNSDGSTSYRDTSHNSVKYYAYLVSERGHSSTESSSTSGTTVQFDGTSYFSSSTIYNDYLVIEPEKYQDQDRNWHTRWHDNGTIAVAVPSGQSIGNNAVTMEGLLAGQYKSNIYLHIVTDY